MTRYMLKVWYAATPDDEPQVHRDLTGGQAETSVHAFLNDLFSLSGLGVRRVSVELDEEDQR